MRGLAKILLIICLSVGATSCEVILPTALVSAAAVGSAYYIISNAEEADTTPEQVIVTPEGRTVVVNDNGSHKVITDSEGNITTIADHGAHKVIHRSDGTSAVVADHGAHKIVIGPDGSHKVVVVP